MSAASKRKASVMDVESTRGGFTPLQPLQSGRPTHHPVRSGASNGAGRVVTGFTIVELLVVIAIMAVLLSAVIALFSNTRAKSRDVRRETDIKTIQNALELYLTNARVYPSTGAGGVCVGATDGTDIVSPALIAAEAIGAVPKDPHHDCGGNFHYHYTATDPSSYTLRFYVETTGTGRDPSQPVTVGP